MKKQIPILMRTPMVQAELKYLKTMTRRTKGLEFINESYCEWSYLGINDLGHLMRNEFGAKNAIKCPYGKIGDFLWVRETFRKYCRVDEHGYTLFDEEIFEYCADGHTALPLVDGDGFHIYNKDGSEKYVPWRPNIHMPKSRARIWLEVTDIRVERVKSISFADAQDEGVEPLIVDQEERYKNYMWVDDPAYIEHKSPTLANPIDSFRTLWDSINGTGSWKANPWVWVISYKILSTTGKPAGLEKEEAV